MFAFAYEVRRANEAVVDPATHVRFLSTRYTTAEAFARRHDAAVAQVGSGSAPYVGVDAEAVAQDCQRDAPAEVASVVEAAPPPAEAETSRKPAATRRKPKPAASTNKKAKRATKEAAPTT